jgi:hypothetical protein
MLFMQAVWTHPVILRLIAMQSSRKSILDRRRKEGAIIGKESRNHNNLYEEQHDRAEEVLGPGYCGLLGVGN